MAHTSWILNVIIFSVILFLNEACPSAVTSDALLMRIRVENKTGTEGFIGFNEHGASIVKPDTEVKISLFGYNFDQVEGIGFTLDDFCESVSYIPEENFLTRNLNLIVIKYKFKPAHSAYKICIKQKPWREYNGDLYERAYIIETRSHIFIWTQSCTENLDTDTLSNENPDLNRDSDNKHLKLCFVNFFASFMLTVIFGSCLMTLILEKKSQIENCTVSSNKTCSKWFEIMSNKQYSDVFLISSDNIEIPSYRCVLAKYSKIFAKIFEESNELPVKINIENFNAEIIHSTLDFLYDKTDSILGKETEVIKFALEYCIQDLIDSCCSFFEDSADPTNVCEYIKIAYSNNFEGLKQKCLKILIEKKKDIDVSKFADLPKNTLIDICRN